MSGTVVVLVSGEALANGHGSTISDQKLNAKELAVGLSPLLTAEIKLAVLHGNKPQVGFVLFRSEVASHALHAIPLDVCGADTQGATGYMISQALRNTLNQHQIRPAGDLRPHPNAGRVWKSRSSAAQSHRPLVRSG